MASVASWTMIRRPLESSSAAPAVIVPSIVTEVPSGIASAFATEVTGRRRSACPWTATGCHDRDDVASIAEEQAIAVEHALSRGSLADDAR